MKQRKIRVRNTAFGQARSQGQLAVRVERDRTKYHRKEKHKKGLTAA